MPTAHPIRVLIAEPFELTRRGIHAVLVADSAFEIIGDLDDLSAVASRCEVEAPDVSVIGVADQAKVADRRLALETVSELVRTNEWTRVVVITDVLSMDDLVEPIRAGAKAVLGRHADEDVLRRAVSAVAQGECFLGTCLAELLFKHLSGETASELVDKSQSAASPTEASHLTPRENQVLQELVHGYRTAEIAAHLGMSPATVKTHVRQICRKLDVHGRTAAILKVLDLQAVAFASLS